MSKDTLDQLRFGTAWMSCVSLQSAHLIWPKQRTIPSQKIYWDRSSELECKSALRASHESSTMKIVGERRRSCVQTRGFQYRFWKPYMKADRDTRQREEAQWCDRRIKRVSKTWSTPKPRNKRKRLSIWMLVHNLKSMFRCKSVTYMFSDYQLRIFIPKIHAN